ncbi:3'(2'),5'-bisphosphate nucleotidase CysQ [Agrobacterium vitis]|uniref:3'(2'),5'-bisphosphate nucleotidase CysQ n=1 Tax=Agrobacterium vitis TaxID=373 RepID=A0AAE4WA76_AGRVI|nr:3'(2'),5'-bisphosphate nucleotidase CysQ [Agrobacterium vitis]MCF1497900.1 3'(2'),5'-bisphosphate nucleotidase CysQ [Allorhizobium sp. Av2]MCM2438634.1 3'(2'),5'-bisphosphate nucleotidase CysQ [Agrobacterium vitis]MUZ56040.1 3'(2'),5'-bisphosphate nucleotidase CysQ [Agrobacterium vitis]MVA64822.1 3'(2'),5'-bisphosphate nucleotidase CysQ [Agrobacterium vitis]MVA85793.1 3'(2'),5'-bisphosphate nucleotidase CysQ [Agrobacterium vitis]
MIDLFEKAAIAAGRDIMDVFHNGPTVRTKSDASPVTEADERAEAIILAALAAQFPAIPVVAEEAVAAGNIPQTRGQPFILVDPLDGTKEFIRKSSDFTVNIALIEAGVPVMGIVYAPARGQAYIGDRSGALKIEIDANFQPVSRQSITVRTPSGTLIAVASRAHSGPETEEFLVNHAITDTRSVGSSLKFCLVAEGAADVYPRFGRTMEWDTAAGDAVLRAAGGITVGPDGAPLLYGKRDQLNDSDFANPSFIAWGGKKA